MDNINIKYGKTCADLKSHKQQFFDNNEELVKMQNECAKVYLKQPKRNLCKACKSELDGSVQFTSHGVKYYVCRKCNHINGECEETAEYSKYLYQDSEYENTIYVSGSAEREKYEKRCIDIYKPKAEFLLDELEKAGVLFENIKILDIGAGAGYFLSALDDLGVKNAYGVDMSKEIVEFGNQYMHNANGTYLKVITEDHLVEEIKSTDANVVTAIGVMEHVIDFHVIYEAIKNNKNIKYFFMMVPMFGLSNILELFCPDVYNRHLGGVHTHVFSHESIDYLNKKYDMRMIAKWQFGTDIMDLYRMCIVKSGKDFANLFGERLYRCIDEMQLVLDKNDFCSEAHMLMKSE